MSCPVKPVPISRHGFVYSLTSEPDASKIRFRGWKTGRTSRFGAVFHYCHECEVGVAFSLVVEVGECFCKHGKMKPIEFASSTTEALGRLGDIRPSHCEVCGNITYKNTLVIRASSVFVMCGGECADVFSYVYPSPGSKRVWYQNTGDDLSMPA